MTLQYTQDQFQRACNSRDEVIATLQVQNTELLEVLAEIETHLDATKAIIEYAIEKKPAECILTDKYNGICPHCESDISWLKHELKAHSEYSQHICAAIAKAKGLKET